MVKIRASFYNMNTFLFCGKEYLYKINCVGVMKRSSYLCHCPMINMKDCWLMCLYCAYPWKLYSTAESPFSILTTTNATIANTQIHSQSKHPFALKNLKITAIKISNNLQKHKRHKVISNKILLEA